VDKVPLDRFAQFFRAAVERYPQSRYWEIVNEADWNIAEADIVSGCFGRYPNQYVELLKVAWKTLHEANPNAELLLSGLAGEDIGWWDAGRYHCEWQDLAPNPEKCFNFSINGGDFTDQILAAGAGPFFDVMNIHFYPAFSQRWAPYGIEVLGKAHYYQQRLAAFNVSKPLAITEVSLRSVPPHNDEDQSRYVVQTFARAVSEGYRPIIWYNLVDDPGYPGYGLLDVNKNPKPSFYAAQTYARELGSAQPVDGHFFGAGFESYRFATPDGGLTDIVWATSETTSTVSLPCPRVRVVDKWGTVTFALDGSPSDADAVTNAQAGVQISASPVFLRLCPAGDLNCNGSVQPDDIHALAQEWGLRLGDKVYNPSHDQDHDGDIDLQDVMFVATHQGDTCSWPS
jgi:hypothetical protein